MIFDGFVISQVVSKKVTRRWNRGTFFVVESDYKVLSDYYEKFEIAADVWLFKCNIEGIFLYMNRGEKNSHEAKKNIFTNFENFPKESWLFSYLKNSLQQYW